MKSWIKKNLKNIIITSFIIPILLVAFVSISHVTTFYGISNPLSWGIYLSVAIEIAAISALAGLSVNMGKFIYIPFGIVTLIQFIGNVFFSFNYIDENSEIFKSWVEMTAALLEPIGVEPNDMSAHKRILSLFSGGLLPLISLTFAHMLVKYSDSIDESNKNIELVDIDKISKDAGKLELQNDEKRWIPTQEEIEKLETILDEKTKVTEEDVVITDEEQENNINSLENKVNRLSYMRRDSNGQN